MARIYKINGLRLAVGGARSAIHGSGPPQGAAQAFEATLGLEATSCRMQVAEPSKGHAKRNGALSAVGAIQLLDLPPYGARAANGKQDVLKGVAYAPFTQRCLRRPCRPTCPRRTCGHAAAPPLILAVALVPVTPVAPCKPPTICVRRRRARTCYIKLNMGRCLRSSPPCRSPLRPLRGGGAQA